MTTGAVRPDVLVTRRIPDPAIERIVERSKLDYHDSPRPHSEG
ncbi:MAG TPA: hypothetical protein VEQ37_12065 [Actinomycetota bacterium]|nr:hypothetical protein [Actinomycetota bacterium]